jgi:hypothetical protein
LIVVGLFRRLAQVLAHMLRGIARVLEGAGSPPGVDSTDAATAALAVRFPGAPDHWLRYIAARAPHLAAANIESAYADAASDAGYSGTPPKVRWWPRSARLRDARLQLQQPSEADTDRHEPVEAPAAHKGNVARERPPTGTRAVGRPKLRFIPSRVLDRQSKEFPAHVEGQTRKKAKAVPATQAPERVTSAHLKIATTRSLERARAELKLDTSHKAASRAALFSGQHHGEPATTTPFSPPTRERAQPTLGVHEQTASYRTARSQLTWWTGRAPRPEREPWTSADHRAGRRTASVVPWAEQGGRHADVTELWSTDLSRSHWPELLPTEPFDIGDAPAQLRNIERLRLEQDFGAWSG